MTILAGTSRGLFALPEIPDEACPQPVLNERGVRELVAINSRLYAGAATGLFASNDAGMTWQNAGIEGRAVWQVRAGRDGMPIYAATEPAGLFRSDDAGQHWREVTSFTAFPEAANWCVPVEPRLPGRARALIVDQDDPRRIRVGVEVGGIMSSDDGGESWRLDLPGQNPDIHMLSAHPARSAVLFASTGYGRLDGVAPMIEGNAGVFRSEDGGVNWTYAWRGVTPRYSRPMCIDARPPYGLTVASAPNAFSNFKDAGGAQAMLFRSEDCGASWRSLGDAAHSPSPVNFLGLAPHPSTPGAVVVGTDTGEVWLVSDNGEWQRLAIGLPPVLSLLAQ